MMQMPPKARAIHLAVTEAVSAASGGQAEEFETATQRLATLDAEQLRVVLGSVVQTLLEAVYPSGLDAEDLGETLTGCHTATAQWWPQLDPNALVVLLTGALGSHDSDSHDSDSHDPDDERPVISATDIAIAAPLLVAHLLKVTGHQLAAYLDASLAEIARAETVEMP